MASTPHRPRLEVPLIVWVLLPLLGIPTVMVMAAVAWRGAKEFAASEPDPSSASTRRATKGAATVAESSNVQTAEESAITVSPAAWVEDLAKIVAKPAAIRPRSTLVNDAAETTTYEYAIPPLTRVELTIHRRSA